MSLYRILFLCLFSFVCLAGAAAEAGTAVNSGGTSITVQPVVAKKGKISTWLYAGVEQWSGDTTYQIGFPVQWANGRTETGPFPVSELSFPLDTTFASLGMTIDFDDTVLANIDLRKNIGDPDDHLTDKDWITPGYPKQLDILSESAITELDAVSWNADLAYKVFKGTQGWLAAGAGYMYQDFEYQAQLIRQWSPSGLTGFDFIGDGRIAIDYSVTYTIPYFLVSGQLNLTPAFSLSGRLAYSPWVGAEDTDRHLLRSMVSKGDMDGNAWMASLTGEWSITPRWFALAGLNFTSIKADGTSSTTFYDVYDHTVAEEIESSQTLFFLRAGYRF